MQRKAAENSTCYLKELYHVFFVL